MVFYGNTSSSVSSTFFDNSVKIISFSLSNDSAGALTVTAGIIEGSTLVNIYIGSIAANSSYQYNGAAIIVKKNTRIYVTSSGASIGYYFSIE